ncbi:MAG: signal peptide peptidase SppA [Bdellovibrionales bacterium]|nr:signal peptide peptidase SppA [Bdellovibrionales bacterium]
MREYFIWLAKIITSVVVFFIFLGMLGGFLASTAKISKESIPTNKKTVAVINLESIILDSEDIIKELYTQVDNDQITAIVLRINSPGGAVGPSQDIYTAVTNLKKIKPVVVSMGAVAASGGLYAALGASKIFAQPGTMTGSIGVVLQVPNVQEITDKVGFKMTTIKAGALKDVGNMYREMSPEEKDFLTGLADETHAEFINAVVEGRGLQISAVNKFADGRVILGSQAKALGLIDEIGGVYEAAASALQLANKPLEKDEIPNLYYPDDKFKEFRKLFEASSFLKSWFGITETSRLMYLMQ